MIVEQGNICLSAMSSGSDSRAMQKGMRSRTPDGEQESPQKRRVPQEYQDVPRWLSEESGILKEVYKRFLTWKGENRLSQNWDTYLHHLPVRKVAEVQRLEDQPFYISAEDLLDFADNLSQTGDGRGPIPYICGPSHTGKTASVLVGCLYTKTVSERRGEVPFTHYLYIPFYNNETHGNYELNISDELYQNMCEVLTVNHMEKLGTVFMSRVLQKVMNGDRGILQFEKFIKRALERPEQEGWWNQKTSEAQKRIHDNLSAFLGQTVRGRVLVHLDEHRRMLNWPGNLRKQPSAMAASFRKGALTSVVLQDNAEKTTETKYRLVSMVVTYVDVPTELPPHSDNGDLSSGNCRKVIPRPSADVDMLMAKNRLLQFDCVPQDLEEKRLKASLKLGLHMLLEVGEHEVNHKQGVVLGHLQLAQHSPELDCQASSEVQHFLKQYEDAIKAGTLKEKLAKCATVCLKAALEAKAFEHSKRQSLACLVERLRGMKDEDVPNDKRLQGGVVALPSRVLTAPLATLVACQPSDKNPQEVSKYIHCSNLFVNALKGIQTGDACSGKVIERAYLWTLAFDEKMDVKEIKAGCILEPDGRGVSGRICKFRKIPEDVLFYADEGKGTCTHPWVDIWCKHNGELLLIEVGCSGRMDALHEKIDHLETLVGELKRFDMPARGIIFAPNLRNSNSVNRLRSPSSGVEVFYSDQAKERLGGLADVLSYLDATEETECRDAGGGAACQRM